MRKNIKVLSAVILATVLAAGTLTACTPPLEGTVLADFSEGAAETFSNRTAGRTATYSTSRGESRT